MEGCGSAGAVGEIVKEYREQCWVVGDSVTDCWDLVKFVGVEIGKLDVGEGYDEGQLGFLVAYETKSGRILIHHVLLFFLPCFYYESRFEEIDRKELWSGGKYWELGQVCDGKGEKCLTRTG